MAVPAVQRRYVFSGMKQHYTDLLTCDPPSGPRICLGQQFALVEASYLLVRLLQQYDSIEPFDRADMAKMRKGMGLTMWPADGVKVRLHQAKA